MLTYVWYFAWIVFFFAWMFVTASCLTLRKQDMDDSWHEADEHDYYENEDEPQHPHAPHPPVMFDALHLRHGLQYLYFENAGN